MSVAALGWLPAHASEASRVSPADDGPGHDGNGCRCPAQVTEGDGALTVTGLPNGDSGGMAWKNGQTYGRWEVRMRVTQDDTGGHPYHPVLILWPDSDNWPDAPDHPARRLLPG